MGCEPPSTEGDAMTEQHTTPSKATRDEERTEATATATPDRIPTPEEEKAAERNSLDPKAATAAKDAYERGANQRGEGRID